MSTWHTVPCLLTLRDEVDALARNRDHGSDGTIGDARHNPTSDHTPDEDSPYLRGKDPDHDNEVHALDVDVDLHEPGVNLASIVHHIIGRCAAGDERRLRYVIFAGCIWEASNGWKARTYHGLDPHTGHAHFSATYDTDHENDTSPWLKELPVRIDNIDELVAQLVPAIVKAMKVRDVDPGPGTYTGDGVEWTDHNRLGAIIDTLDRIESKVGA